MKKNILFIGICLIFLISCSNNSWEKAHKSRTIEAYQDYIANNPEAENIAEAQVLLDSLLLLKKTQDEINDWEKAKQENTAESYKNYLDAYNNGEYAYEAFKGIFHSENPEFIEKYSRIIDFFDKMQESEAGSDLFIKYFAEDKCLYNDDILTAPYLYKRFEEDESQNLYKDAYLLEGCLFDYIIHPGWGLVKDETETEITLTFEPMFAGIFYYFKWEYQNNKYVITEMQVWNKGD